jgi:hypothetical protein
VTAADFTRTINILRDKATGWNFHAVIAFAKDEAEAAAFRTTLKAAVTEKQYENIVFIDALSTPLGSEAFEQYVDFSAMAMYYQGSNNTSSRECSDKAKRVLDQDWRNRIYNGQFIVYTYANQEGENSETSRCGKRSSMMLQQNSRMHSTCKGTHRKSIEDNSGYETVDKSGYYASHEWCCWRR